jgi:hypothetical protein
VRQFVVDDKGCVMIAAFGLPQYSYEVTLLSSADAVTVLYTLWYQYAQSGGLKRCTKPLSLHSGYMTSSYNALAISVCMHRSSVLL